MLEALRKTTSVLLDPDRRFTQARLFHATRVALAILVSIALTTGIRIPHGEWATITVLVVIGGLQHHGNIRRRAAERGAGTLIGALVGLVLIIQQSYFGSALVTYLLMALACGYCAYHAIGKGGYIALLAAVTVVITAGHGDQDIYDAVWRTVDVLIGTAVALIFSFALPAYASYTWRFKLAELLRASAAVHAKIERGYASAAEQQKDMMRLGTLLVPLRGLIPSVAKETGLPAARLEEVQHSARVCISALELLAAVQRNNADAGDDVRGIRRLLLELADGLESGDMSAAHHDAPLATAVQADAADGQRSFTFLTMKLAAELGNLQDHLAQMANQCGFPYARP